MIQQVSQSHTHNMAVLPFSPAKLPEPLNLEDTIHTVKSQVSQPALVTCTVNEHHKVIFEIDTGASCNILPLADHIKATGDKQGTWISPTKTRLTMVNNTSATWSWKSDEEVATHICCIFSS